MKIMDVKAIGVECRLPQTVYDANYEMATKAALLVEVVTDEGLPRPRIRPDGRVLRAPARRVPGESTPRADD